jgi:hypothetical protein
VSDPVSPLRVVVADTMTFAYLQALGELGLLVEVATRTGKIGVTKSVLQELSRAAELGLVAQTWCDRKQVTLFSPVVDDPVSRIVSGIVGTPRSRLVRRNRVDTELIEIAALHDGAVLSSELGIQKLAAKREVPTLDLVGLLAWAVRIGVTSPSDAEACVRPWSTASASATGVPYDFRGSFSETARRRGKRLVTLLDALADGSGA